MCVDACLVIKGEHTLTVRWKPGIVEMLDFQKPKKLCVTYNSVFLSFQFNGVFTRFYETKKCLNLLGSLVNVISPKHEND